MTWREKRKLKDGDERDNSRAEEGVLALRLEIANWQWVTLTANSTRKLGKATVTGGLLGRGAAGRVRDSPGATSPGQSRPKFPH